MTKEVKEPKKKIELLDDVLSTLVDPSERKEVLKYKNMKRRE
jgi:hypothetical protein